MKTVLFICVENSCRSQMAEGFARAIGAGRWEARSAGSRPSGVVNAKAVEFMQERGVDLSKHRSKGLTELPDARWDAVVTMGCGDRCPDIRANARIDWDIPDPKFMAPDGFRAVRDDIELRVRSLVAEDA